MNDKCASGTVRAVRVAAADTGDDELAAAVSAAAPTEGLGIYTIVDTLLAIGGPEAERRARPLMARLNPQERVSMFWTHCGRDAKDGLTRFQQLDIVDRQLSAQKDLPRAPWSDHPTQQMIFDWLLTLAAVNHDFDTEADVIPCRHDVLIHELAAITHGRFRPSAVREIWKPTNDDDGETPYQMELVADGRLYRFEAKNLGGWYDVTSVLAVLNRALSESRQAERFVALDTGDQTSAIIFGDPQQIRLAAAEDWIALTIVGKYARPGQPFVWTC